MDKLTEKGPGNPAFVKGVAQNPGGRPKGSINKKSHPKIQERLLGKWQTHPADRLVQIANFLERTGEPDNMIEAAAIWTNLLKYFEPTKKPVETAPEKTTPQESKEAAEETYRLLQELESGSSSISSNQEPSVASGTTEVPPQTSPEENLRGHTEQ